MRALWTEGLGADAIAQQSGLTPEQVIWLAIQQGWLVPEDTRPARSIDDIETALAAARFDPAIVWIAQIEELKLEKAALLSALAEARRREGEGLADGVVLPARFVRGEQPARIDDSAIIARLKTEIRQVRREILAVTKDLMEFVYAKRREAQRMEHTGEGGGPIQTEWKILPVCANPNAARE